ncbi:DNA polymerase iota [Drosophila guanche]|uniref:Blast:Multiple coagulation factor deficiency protein 2 homolog n=1 Tax=Drosophila guanche TaxID=7266 RepID=A0A3B0JL79_DROGU|nr:DNA polymerase iota [Drosophila guanche]XP_034131446.1 DNA polymerase iota [Drosophila guanche]SPP83074.1 blast:Multiple coagulation factor deficiency protein 2 homolog [Drosophila guanche]
MDFTSVLAKSEAHQRTIVHLDMDYFYAQVEEIRNPTLRTKALGIQQKSIVVTCNYVARAQGVHKLMLVEDALQVCPDLVLVNGEDLTPYRLMSQKIFDLLLNYTPMVEKLGFDENFMDVSALVELRQAHAAEAQQKPPVGHTYPADGTLLTTCSCGCAQRLAIGTRIAQEIREELKLRLGITCCAGISYNKLLAKLVGSSHKPNQQTVLVSTYAEQFMRELYDLKRVTGIGQKTQCLLLEAGMSTIEQLQQCDMDVMRKKFGFETATKLRDLAFGRDSSTVRPTGKPKTIGMEDACKPISVCTDVEERFRMLLIRLIEQVAEDGRIPIAIKVVLRKYDSQKKSSHRETKQANILPSLFKTSMCAGEMGVCKVQLADGAQDKLLKIVMRLFERIVDLNKPFNITLIGLAFSKFQERKVGSSSIANFLIKKADLEVQAITSLTNTSLTSPTAESPTSDETAFRSSPTTFKPSDQFYRRRATTASPIPMLLDNGSESAATNSDVSDFSETEVEPSPKKSRIGRMLVSKRSRLAVDVMDTAADVASPSKLRVCDLRLNSRDSEKDFPMSPIASSSTPSTSASGCSSVAPRFRTIQPPNTLLNRIDGSLCFMATRTDRRISSNASSTASSPLPSPMDDSMSAPCTPTATASDSLPGPNNSCTSSEASVHDANDVLTEIACPAGVDAEVFKELPVELQNELIASWRSSLVAAVEQTAAAAATTTANSVATARAGAPATASAGARNRPEKNTLYRYFLRNK